MQNARSEVVSGRIARSANPAKYPLNRPFKPVTRVRQSHALGNVDHRLKEIIRIQLARGARDPYFAGLRSPRAMAEGLTEQRIDAGSGDFEHDPQFSESEKWALRCAFLMYRKPAELDRDFYDEGKQHFTEAQIMELGGLIALHYGMQVFMRTLQPALESDPQS